MSNLPNLPQTPNSQFANALHLTSVGGTHSVHSNPPSTPQSQVTPTATYPTRPNAYFTPSTYYSPSERQDNSNPNWSSTPNENMQPPPRIDLAQILRRENPAHSRKDTLTNPNDQPPSEKPPLPPASLKATPQTHPDHINAEQGASGMDNDSDDDDDDDDDEETDLEDELNKASREAELANFGAFDKAAIFHIPIEIPDTTSKSREWVAVKLKDCTKEMRHVSQNPFDFLTEELLALATKPETPGEDVQPNEAGEQPPQSEESKQLALWRVILRKPGFRMLVRTVTDKQKKVSTSRLIHWCDTGVKSYLSRFDKPKIKAISIVPVSTPNQDWCIVSLTKQGYRELSQIHALFDPILHVAILLRPFSYNIPLVQSFIFRGIYNRYDQDPRTATKTNEIFTTQMNAAMGKSQTTGKITDLTKVNTDPFNKNTQATVTITFDSNPVLLKPATLPKEYNDIDNERRPISQSWLGFCGICHSESHRKLTCPWVDHQWDGSGTVLNRYHAAEYIPGSKLKKPNWKAQTDGRKRKIEEVLGVVTDMRSPKKQRKEEIPPEGPNNASQPNNTSRAMEVDSDQIIS